MNWKFENKCNGQRKIIWSHHFLFSFSKEKKFFFLRKKIFSKNQTHHWKTIRRKMFFMPRTYFKFNINFLDTHDWFDNNIFCFSNTIQVNYIRCVNCHSFLKWERKSKPIFYPSFKMDSESSWDLNVNITEINWVDIFLHFHHSSPTVVVVVVVSFTHLLLDLDDECHLI